MKILLDEYMFKNNLTTRQVSIATGIPPTTINYIVNGKISPKMITMEKLAKGLKIHISDLYESNFK